MAERLLSALVTRCVQLHRLTLDLRRALARWASAEQGGPDLQALTPAALSERLALLAKQRLADAAAAVEKPAELDGKQLKFAQLSAAAAALNSLIERANAQPAAERDQYAAYVASLPAAAGFVRALPRHKAPDSYRTLVELADAVAVARDKLGAQPAVERMSVAGGLHARLTSVHALVRQLRAGREVLSAFGDHAHRGLDVTGVRVQMKERYTALGKHAVALVTLLRYAREAPLLAFGAVLAGLVQQGRLSLLVDEPSLLPTSVDGRPLTASYDMRDTVLRLYAKRRSVLEGLRMAHSYIENYVRVAEHAVEQLRSRLRSLTAAQPTLALPTACDLLAAPSPVAMLRPLQTSAPPRACRLSPPATPADAARQCAAVATETYAGLREYQRRALVGGRLAAGAQALRARLGYDGDAADLSVGCTLPLLTDRLGRDHLRRHQRLLLDGLVTAEQWAVCWESAMPKHVLASAHERRGAGVGAGVPADIEAGDAGEWAAGDVPDDDLAAELEVENAYAPDDDAGEFDVNDPDWQAALAAGVDEMQAALEEGDDEMAEAAGAGAAGP